MGQTHSNGNIVQCLIATVLISQKRIKNTSRYLGHPGVTRTWQYTVYFYSRGTACMGCRSAQTKRKTSFEAGCAQASHAEKKIAS